MATSSGSVSRSGGCFPAPLGFTGSSSDTSGSSESPGPSESREEVNLPLVGGSAGSSRPSRARGGASSSSFVGGLLYEASSMTEDEVSSLKERYGIPRGFRVWAPGSEDRVCCCDEGVVAMYEEFLAFGLRFPIHPLITEVLDRYKVVPCQLAPNSFRTMVSWIVLCHLAQVSPRLSLFQAFFILVRLSGAVGSFGFYPRPNRKLFQFPGSSRGWKNRFFLMSSEGGWGFGTVWGEPDVSPNYEKDIIEEDDDDTDVLLNVRVPGVEELLSETNLKGAGIIPGRGKNFRTS